MVDHLVLICLEASSLPRFVPKITSLSWQASLRAASNTKAAKALSMLK